MQPFLVPGCIAAACLLIWGVLLVPTTTLSGMDFLNLIYPQTLLVREIYGQGRVPLWNWYSWCGCPLLAAMQSAPLYPPLWLVLWLPQPFGLQLSIFAHLLFAGLGAGLLARTWDSSCELSEQRGRAVLPSAYAGIAYCCGSFFLGHVEQVNSVAALAWAPWIFLAALRYLEKGAGLWAFGAAVAMALLAGHPQHVVLAVLFLEVFALVRLLANWRSGPGQIQRLLLLQLGLVVAGLLAAAQLLPAQELSRLSERVWPYPDPNAPAFEWKYLPAFVMPRFFNRLADTPGQPLLYSELGVYCGLLTFPLFAVGLVRCLRRRAAADIALLATWLLALLYAMGAHGGVTPVFYRLVPFLYHSRGAARSLNIETLCYALLAARGIQSLAFLHQPLVTAGVLCALAGDLAFAHSAELLSNLVPRELLETQLFPAQQIAAQEGPSRIYRFMVNDSDYYLDHRAPAVAQRIVRLQPNLNVLWQLKTTDGYEEGLLPPRRTANLLRRFNRNLHQELLDAPLLALMGCRYVYTETPADLSRNWRRVPAGLPMPYQLWESQWPSAWFLDASTLPASYSSLGPAEPELVYEPTRKAAARHAYDQLTSAAIARAIQPTHMRVTGREANRLNFVWDSADPGEFLFLQAPFPGWQLCWGKGQRRPLERVSPLFSKLRLPVGFKGLDMSVAYEPFSFRLGLFVTLATLTAFGMTYTLTQGPAAARRLWHYWTAWRPR